VGSITVAAVIELTSAALTYNSLPANVINVSVKQWAAVWVVRHSYIASSVSKHTTHIFDSVFHERV
jgi:hypothetical protein